MQFNAQRADLARLLADVAKVVEKRNTIPILCNVLLTATKDGSLSVRATDLGIAITKTIPASVSEPGSITVDAGRFQAIVSKMAGAEVSFTLDYPVAKLKCGRSRFSLPTIPAEDFPDIKVGDFDHSFDLDISAFVAPVRFAISTEETRYYLNGVFVHTADTGTGATVLRAVSTDGHRLAYNAIPLPQGAGGLPGGIISRKTIDLLSIFKGVAKVSLSATKICIEQDGTSLVAKLIDGTFPDYMRVIPKDNDKIVSLDRADFAAAVDRANTVAGERGHGIKLAVASGGVTISMQSVDGSASEEIEASYSGAPLDVGYNARYLGEILAASGGDCVVLSLADPGSPALVTNPANENWLGVIMPVRV